MASHSPAQALRAQQQQQVVHGVPWDEAGLVHALREAQVQHVVVQLAHSLLQLLLAEVVAAKCAAATTKHH